MSNTDEIRWLQRLENFGKALAQLKAACQKEKYSELERAGLVKIFEFTFELSWKVLKDRLFYEGYEVKSPRATIRQAFEMEYISEDDCEAFLDALDKRNLMSHTYEEEVAQEAEKRIRQIYVLLLDRLHSTLESHRPK